MFAQFFGGYLFNKKLVSSEDLTQAFEDKNNTRMRLGVLAINAGLMTAEQVEHVNVTQQSVDKRSVGIAVCGVDNHPLRLVDDEQTVVFIYNIKRDVLRLRVVRLGIRELKTDGFTA